MCFLTKALALTTEIQGTGAMTKEDKWLQVLQIMYGWVAFRGRTMLAKLAITLANVEGPPDLASSSRRCTVV